MNKVLIVEDEMLEQDFLKSLAQEKLSPEDTLLTCETGIQAVELAKQHKPNIIIMDILIPEIDGLTAIEKIRSFLPNACITILSAYSDFSYAQKAISLNVYKYLLKPVKPRDFHKVFQEMLDKKTKCVSQIEGKLEENTISSDNSLRISMEKSVRYIEENFREKLTLEDVASKAFMNPKYFSRVFKKEIGTSFSNYVNNLKI